VNSPETDLKQIWEEALEDLRGRAPRPTLETWLKSIVPVEMQGEEVVLGVPHEFAKDWLEGGYQEVIQESVSNVMDKDVKIKFVVHALAGRASEEKAEAQTSGEREDKKMDWGVGFGAIPLNRKYTFEDFVVGDSNRFAQAAALAVATNPGSKYNPLFIHGGVGLGKTHLMQAIGHRSRQRHPGREVVYVPGETFVYHVVSSIREDKTDLFRKKYRNVDIWLVDDVQSIAGKERTEAEFFHTFNALYETNKQIVITSDCPPKELELISERLKSRFEWGLIADIRPPDTETRIAILERKMFGWLEGGGPWVAAGDGNGEMLKIPYEVLSYIADLIQTNVRVLEGALQKVMAFTSLYGQKVTLEKAKEILKDYSTEDGPFRITLEMIQQKVCERFGVPLEEIVGKGRSKTVVVPRQVGMYLCRELTDLTLPEIGKGFGGRDHSTVIHSYRKTNEMMEENSTFRKLVEELAESLQPQGQP
jgi:chromosomal replication initiator protein